MAISPSCASCGNELGEFGAILLGPPDEQDKALKSHLCTNCYKKVLASLENNE